MDEMNPQALNLEAKRIIALLKSEFVFPDGSFFLEKEGNKIFPYRIYPDLGDFLPFFLYFDEDEFVESQVFLYQKSLKNGLLVSEFDTFGISGLVKSYEYTDLMLGLADLYDLRPSDIHKKLLMDTAEKAIKVFSLDKKLSSYYYPRFRLHLPLLDTRDGTLVELFLDLHRLIGDEKYLEIAKNIFNNLINLDFYKIHLLLPSFSAPVLKIGKKFNSANICKNTTNSLFGFLALAKAGHRTAFKEITKIVSKLKDVSEDIGGGIPFNFDPVNRGSKANLTASFPVIDFLCDLYEEDKNPSHLDFAKKVADFWIDKRGKTGLFPSSPDSIETFFDSETDMCVALYKLWEQTGDLKYQNVADRCFAAILECHGKNDYPLIVDINTGEIVNGTQRTKFLALFLKLIILKIEYEKGEKIYSNKNLYGLLRDR